MKKIITFGFVPIVFDFIRGQNATKGQKLFTSGHVRNVVETVDLNQPGTITCTVVAQTKVSNLYTVKLILDHNRHVTYATCTCKAGLSKRCKHVCALVHFINSPESSASKTNQPQGWGKPSHRQLLGYDKGARMSKLFPTPSSSSETRKKLAPLEISTSELGDSLAETPLFTMLKVEEKNEKEILAAASLVEIMQATEKRICEERAKQITLEILMLQYANIRYNPEIIIARELFDFYSKNVCCDINAALTMSVQTITQSKNPEWFKERKLRITASSAHRLKGNRFDKAKVIGSFLNPGNVETASMSYGKKNEERALQEYKKLLSPGCEVVKVGLIVCIQQPWLCCSPDAILTYGRNIWDKHLIEIKCPFTCRNKPIFDQEKVELNVKYLKLDENGIQLSKSHSIYIQVQIQMYVTNIALCDLFIYSPKGSLLIQVKRDDVLLSNLVPRLQQFYFNDYIQRLLETYS